MQPKIVEARADRDDGVIGSPAYLDQMRLLLLLAAAQIRV